MAGLTLDDTVSSAPTVLADRDANNVVTVSLSSGVWADYQINTGLGDGWSIWGPDSHPGGLALSGSTDVLEDKTFTPVLPGRYLIKVVCRDAATGTTQSTFTATYEVGSAYGSEAIPAPQERDEYQNETGWSRSYEERLSDIERMAGGRVTLRAYNNTGGALAYGDIVKLDGYRRHKTAGDGADAMSLHLRGINLQALTTDATQADIGSQFIAVALESINNGENGLFLIQGYMPLDTSSYSAEGDSVYVTDAGVTGTTAGTNTRVCGYVLQVAASTMATANAGALLFLGIPYSIPSVPAGSSLFDERSLAFNADTDQNVYEVVGGDALNAGDIGPSTATITATLVATAYITTASQDGTIQLYNVTDSQVVATISVTSTTPSRLTSSLTIGSGATDLRNDGTKVYELRIKRDALTVPADRVALMKASILFESVV
jgi:predicted RecA/RadA family phage recombinase